MVLCLGDKVAGVVIILKITSEPWRVRTYTVLKSVTCKLHTMIIRRIRTKQSIFPLGWISSSKSEEVTYIVVAMCKHTGLKLDRVYTRTMTDLARY